MFALNKLSVAVAFASCASCAFALDVADATFVSYSTNVAKLVAAPVAADATLPAEAGVPSFHFDALRTNETGKAWTFTNGTVTRIPSLSNDRYLTADFSQATWTGWSSTQVPLAPSWTYDADLGASVVDFGAVASKKAMTFDPWSPADGVAATNGLANIGTVFAVVKNCGGWLMGGSFGGTAANRYAWHRAYSKRAKNDPNKVDSPILSDYSDSDLKNGNIRLNGMPLVHVQKCGFSGGWDYLTLRTKAAKVGAFGLGIGDARSKALDNSSMNARSGGIAFAELIVYPTILSDELCKRIEAMLAKKWLDNRTPGYGSHAAVAEVRVAQTTSVNTTPDDGTGGMQGVAEVAEGKTLSIGLLRGGRGMSASFSKKGAGRMEVGDASSLGGSLAVESGTLAFVRRPIPAALALTPALRFDASAEGAVTSVDGYVTRWRNDGDEVLLKETCYAGAVNDAARPRLIANALNGKPAVDFGPHAKNGSGCVLHLMTNNDQRVQIDYPATYVAVLAADEGGGHVLGTDSLFSRGDDPSVFWKPLHGSSPY